MSVRKHEYHRGLREQTECVTHRVFKQLYWQLPIIIARWILVKLTNIRMCTARVRSTKEGNVYSLSVHRGRRREGTPPVLVLARGREVPRSGLSTGFPRPLLLFPPPQARTRTGGIPPLPSTCHGQDTPRAVRLLRSQEDFLVMLLIRYDQCMQ